MASVVKVDPNQLISQPIYNAGRVIGYEMVPIGSVQSYRGNASSGYITSSDSSTENAESKGPATPKYGSNPAAIFDLDLRAKAAAAQGIPTPAYNPSGLSYPKSTEPNSTARVSAQSVQPLAAPSSITPQSSKEILAGAKEADREYLSRALGIPAAAISDQMLSNLGSYSYENLARSNISEFNASTTSKAQDISATKIGYYSGVPEIEISVQNFSQSQNKNQPSIQQGNLIGGYTGATGVSYSFVAGKSYGISTEKGEQIITPYSVQIEDTNSPKFVEFAKSQNPQVIAGFSTNNGPGLVLAPPAAPPYKMTSEEKIITSNQKQAESMEASSGYSVLTGAPVVGFVFQAISPFRFESFIQSVPAYASTAINYKAPEILQGLSSKNPENFIIQEGRTFQQGAVGALTDPKTYVAAALGAGISISEGNLGFGFRTSAQSGGARIVLSEPKATTTFRASAELEAPEFVAAKSTGLSYGGSVQGKDVISMGEPAGIEGLKAPGTFKVETTTTIQQSNPIIAAFSKPSKYSTEITGTIEAFEPKQPAIQKGPFGNQESMLTGAKVNLAGQASNVIDVSFGKVPKAGSINAAPRLLEDLSTVKNSGPSEFTFTTSRSAKTFTPKNTDLNVLNLQRGGAILQPPDYSLAYNIKATQGLTAVESASEISVPFKVERIANEAKFKPTSSKSSASDILEIQEGQKLPSVLEITKGEGVRANKIDIIEISREIRSISKIDGKISATKNRISDLVAQKKGDSVEILYKSGKTERYGQNGQLKELKISGESVLRAKGSSLSNEKIYQRSEVFPLKPQKIGLGNGESLPPLVANKGDLLKSNPGSIRNLGAGTAQLQLQTTKSIGTTIAELGEKTAAKSQLESLQSPASKQISLNLKLSSLFKIGQSQRSSENIRPLSGSMYNSISIQKSNQRVKSGQDLISENTRQPITRGSSLVSTITSQLGNVRTGQLSISRQSQSEISNTRVAQSQFIRNNQVEITNIRQELPPPPIPPIEIQNITPPPPPPPQFGFSLGNESNTTRSSGTSKRQPSKYTPSLIASLLNLRGKKEDLGGYQSGFGVRLIPTKAKKGSR